jgi:hypothetical protein
MRPIVHLSREKGRVVMGFIRVAAIYARRNAVAFLALLIALAGTSYAAATLPPNSVGTAQIKRAAVTLDKVSRSARRALVRKRGRRGTTGPTGPRGAPCSPSIAACVGPPGAAKGFGLIVYDGTVDSRFSKGITNVVYDPGDGQYCIQTNFPIKGVAVTAADMGGQTDRLFSASLDGVAVQGECLGEMYPNKPNVVVVKETSPTGSPEHDADFFITLN